MHGTSGEGFNEADVRFATMMLPHHEQAVEMSTIILAADGIDADVVDLAIAIKAAQQPEIDTMNTWLDDWGVTAMTGHGMEGSHGLGGMSGDDMGGQHGAGMLTEAELDRLRAADGVEAERLFLQGMIAHHEGAIDMAEAEIEDGEAPAAVQLARAIARDQQAQIEQMERMLG